MVFKSNIPQGTDRLITSQGDLLANNSQLDTSFGVDHVTYTDATADNGKHDKVTSVDQAGHVTTTTEPIIYGTDLAGTNTGVLHFSRGPSDSVPTPLTALHGNIASLASSSSTLFDFTGMADGTMVKAWVVTPSGSLWSEAFVGWHTGAIIGKGSMRSANISLRLQVSGTSLVITTNAFTATDIFWTLHFLRTQ